MKTPIEDSIKTMLELSAKIVNISGDFYLSDVDTEEEGCFIFFGLAYNDENDCRQTWNPLLISEQSIELMSKIGMTVDCSASDSITVTHPRHEPIRINYRKTGDDYLDDRVMAIRYAITKMASLAAIDRIKGTIGKSFNDFMDLLQDKAVL